jgi:hypothetical protein
MDLERFPLLGVPLSTSHFQIYRIMIGKSTTMQDQSHRVIVIRQVSIYYVMKFDTPDKLRVVDFIV